MIVRSNSTSVRDRNGAFGEYVHWTFGDFDWNTIQCGDSHSLPCIFHFSVFIYCGLTNPFKIRLWNITRISHILGAISPTINLRNQATSAFTTSSAHSFFWQPRNQEQSLSSVRLPQSSPPDEISPLNKYLRQDVTFYRILTA